MLGFLNKFSIFCFLDNNNYDFDKSYECVVGAGIFKSIIASDNWAFSDTAKFQNQANDWVFGHVSYDVKNEIENLHSLNPDRIELPEYLFFIPEVVFIITGNILKIGVGDNSYDAAEVFNEIISYKPKKKANHDIPAFKSRFSRTEYTDTVKEIQKHILRGDCYELNFCQEFFAVGATIDPLGVFSKLVAISPNPFSALYKYKQKYLVCASPERFLKKRGSSIISQPMKGTAKRILFDEKADNQLKEQLQNDQKERSENIMIVDLVRNDLAKICVQGSVTVTDFLRIQTFPQVHQMISTVKGKLKKNISLADIFSATFPMGSMTGAPKKRVMELIEKYERTKRGLFSGTVGYIEPGGDFDFNVVIRSILYNQSEKYLSIQVGSAITFKSDPDSEYDECLLKISALRKALE